MEGKLSSIAWGLQEKINWSDRDRDFPRSLGVTIWVQLQLQSMWRDQMKESVWVWVWEHMQMQMQMHPISSDKLASQAHQKAESKPRIMNLGIEREYACMHTCMCNGRAACSDVMDGLVSCYSPLSATDVVGFEWISMPMKDGWMAWYCNRCDWDGAVITEILARWQFANLPFWSFFTHMVDPHSHGFHMVVRHHSPRSNQ